MTDAASADLPATCPSCGAVVRQSVPWCLQCYASLRPQPDPQPDAEPQPVPHADPSLAGAPAPHATEAGLPGAAPQDVDALAERMLAELRASEKAQPAWLSRFPASGGARAGAIAGLLVGVGVVLVLVLTVVGHLL